MKICIVVTTKAQLESLLSPGVEKATDEGRFYQLYTDMGRKGPHGGGAHGMILKYV